MTLRTCPDCCADNRGGMLDHEKTCPLGQAIDKSSAADREFFVAHPGTDFFCRAVDRADILAMESAGTPLTDPKGWRVRVTALGPGVRQRNFFRVKGAATLRSDDTAESPSCFATATIDPPE